MSRKQYVEEVINLLSDPISDDISDSFLTLGTTFTSKLLRTGSQRPAVNLPNWQYMNQFLRGFALNEFTILCGPTGTGKTTLLASWALELAATNVPFYIAAVEIGSDEFMGKMIGALIGKDFEDLEVSDRDAVLHKCKSILGSQTSFMATYDSRVSHINMLADILYAHRHSGTKVAFIDNLNFMLDVKRSSDSLIEMDRVIHDFVIFCKKIPIHIVMVMHPRKTEGGRIVSEFDIKGSSTSVQEAANVLLLNRLERQDLAPIGRDPKTCREMTIAKSRFNGRHAGKRLIMALHEKSELLSEVAYAK